MDQLMLGVFLVVIVVGIVAQRRSRQRLEQALQASFRALEFDTPHGTVSGAQLRVVKICRSPMLADDGVEDEPADAFWYCVSEDRSYFLAIAMIHPGAQGVVVNWAVRPLTEERMRGALVGDSKASALAFGDAIEG
ncbi:hypothetical protein [Lysobacter sp.]|uniref:hypothetical protein n=1 Tax=Lysobacter sp. TaxID=72226 RepID=UPI002D6ABB66|nr:hypothetical protein [Lysobacter sp.]HZX77070.1 hypothetical protein [Lysobacter sp.]